MERFKPIQSNLLSSHDGVDISPLPQCRDSLRMYIKEGSFGVLRRQIAYGTNHCAEILEIGGLRCLQRLRSYHEEVETRNREEIPFSLQTDPRGLSVAEGL